MSDAIKTRPILFSAPMVNALLQGRKTQTRRKLPIQPTPNESGTHTLWRRSVGSTNQEIKKSYDSAGTLLEESTRIVPLGEWLLEKCPYRVGMQLWVRETFLLLDQHHWHDLSKPRESMIEAGAVSRRNGVAYRAETSADGEEIRSGYGYKWRPSIFMPRWASRITLEITDVRVERLQEISEEDAIAEGMREFGTTGMFGYDLKGTPGPMVGGTAREAFALLWGKINGPESWAANPWTWAITFKGIQG